MVARVEVEKLASALGGRQQLAERLPRTGTLDPALWRVLLARSARIWVGADLSETDARGYPDQLLVLSGDFVALPPLPTAPRPIDPAAPAPIGVAEPVWPTPYGVRHVVVASAPMQRRARLAAQAPEQRLAPPVDFGPDQTRPSDAALELWLMLDERTVREWTGPFADAFLRPLVLRLDALRALQLSIDVGAHTTTLRLALHPVDPRKLSELQRALQSVLDSVKSELTDPGPRALFGDPRVVVEQARAQVSWTLPSALALDGTRQLLR